MAEISYVASDEHPGADTPSGCKHVNVVWVHEVGRPFGMGDARVELSRLAVGENKVLLSEGEPVSSRDDVQPFVALVHPLFETFRPVSPPGRRRTR